MQDSGIYQVKYVYAIFLAIAQTFIRVPFENRV